MQNSKLKMAIRATAARLLVPCFAFFIFASANGEIPEPDNVLYGTIALDGAPVTAARRDVIIAARRTSNGPAIASYRMGANARIGNFYALALSLESLLPTTDPGASQAGESLIIVVSDASGLRGQTSYTLGERGQIQRVDFGAAVPDSDGDTLPDAWELFHFGNLNQNGNSIAPNGRTVLQSFVSGGDPFDPNSASKLSITLSNNQKIVSFLALRAEGAGYEGRSRFYAVESSPGLSAALWTGVTGFTNIAGNNQTLIFQTTSTNSPAFFRTRVWLQPP